MPKAIEIREISASKLSNENHKGARFATIRCIDKDGEIFDIAFLSTSLIDVVDLAAAEYVRASGLSLIPDTPKIPFDAHKFDFSFEPSSGNFILSIVFGAGGILSFRLDHKILSELYESFGVGLGKQAYSYGKIN